LRAASRQARLQAVRQLAALKGLRLGRLAEALAVLRGNCAPVSDRHRFLLLPKLLCLFRFSYNNPASARLRDTSPVSTVCLFHSPPQEKDGQRERRLHLALLAIASYRMHSTTCKESCHNPCRSRDEKERFVRLACATFRVTLLNVRPSAME